jgi:hypothetical protein
MKWQAVTLGCAVSVAFLSSDGAVARGDVVTDWNLQALNAVKGSNTPPPMAARNLAMVHAAVFDAVNAVDPKYQSYRATVAPQPGASAEAAAVEAAFRVLGSLYPQQLTAFAAKYGQSLDAIPDSPAKQQGRDLGQVVAQQIIDWRSGDGSTATVVYSPGTQPGQWRPTPAANVPALYPHWPNLVPFAMTGGNQFRPAGPPALDSARYAQDYDQVKALGAKTSAVRTAEQTEIARFWADGAGTVTPPGHWNMIAADVAQQRGNTLAENARLFALVNVAMADAGIVSWDAKYQYNFWRPISAILEGDTDGNDATASDAAWEPLLVTPPFPENTSGHSTFSGAASTILTSLYGDDFAFTTDSDGLPGVTRSFLSFSGAADEAGISRIYGGIHFQFSNEQGLATGRQLGDYVFANYLTAVPEPAGIFTMIVFASSALTRRPSRRASTAASVPVSV